MLGFAFDPPGQDAGPLSSSPLVQGLHGQHLVVDGRAFVLLRAEVCSDRALDPLAALLHNAKLVIGALVLAGNHYVLRYCLPLGSLDLADLDYALEYLAREAAMTRARVAQHVASPEVKNRVPHWTE